MPDLHDDIPVRRDAHGQCQGPVIVAQGLVESAIVTLHVAEELEGQCFLAGQRQLARLAEGLQQLDTRRRELPAQAQDLAERESGPAQAHSRTHLLEQAHGCLQFRFGAAEVAALAGCQAQVQAIAAHVLDHAQGSMQLVRPTPPDLRLVVARLPESHDAQQVGGAGALESATEQAEQREGRFGILA